METRSELGAPGAPTGLLVALAVAAALTGCPTDEPQQSPVHVDVVEACENLGPQYCLLPWPSSRYLEPAADTATGWRVAYPDEALPPNIDDAPFDVSPYRRLDGFPPSAQILALFDAPVDVSTLPSQFDYEASLDVDCPTVILDVESGARIPHFAEIDVRADDPSATLLYLRPAHRLAEDRRYAVALRGLRHDDGSEVAASPAFAAIRDGVPTDAPQLEARRASLDEALAALAAAGVARERLTLAWDFHTASGPALYGDLLHMRDDALQRVTDVGLGCSITAVHDDVDEHVLRRIEGTVEVPLYMDGPYTGARLVYGDDGLPAYQGTHDVEFTAIIPRSLAAGDPGRLLMYGHGFYLGGSQVADPWQTEFLDELRMAGASINWAGMSEDDIVTAAAALADLSGFPAIPDRLRQAVVNQLVAMRTLSGVCADEVFAVDDRRVIDVEQRYFMGISLGSIMGTTTAAVSPDLDRAVLHVGGAIFPLLQTRSIHFAQFDAVYSAWYEPRVDREVLWSLIGQLFEHVEPITYLPHLIDDPLPGAPAKRIYYPVARNDAEVPNVATDVGARTAGFPLMRPTSYDVWGLDDAPSAPFDGSAMQYFDCGDPDVPVTNEPPEDNSAHHCVRHLGAFADAVDAFLRPDGVLIDACDGPCDPE